MIDPYTGQWDEQLINDVFWEEDGQLILKMPLRAGTDDFMAWNFDPKGVFSVNQAYKLQRALKEVQNRRK